MLLFAKQGEEVLISDWPREELKLGRGKVDEEEDHNTKKAELKKAVVKKADMKKAEVRNPPRHDNQENGSNLSCFEGLKKAVKKEETLASLSNREVIEKDSDQKKAVKKAAKKKANDHLSISKECCEVLTFSIYQ
ncbi:hypothetical protein SELMODRAFT_403426 [Selaginella moellendorffii]|uniref:Uncharacterized protein n=1 Tax=Selaginella moellendorffii TaxID=88036 RepID=D8QRD4_SELML|nr:hypothetical protein SELMODRAFT_403426 [Selaginella moellendorffii]